MVPSATIGSACSRSAGRRFEGRYVTNGLTQRPQLGASSLCRVDRRWLPPQLVCLGRASTRLAEFLPLRD